MYHLRPLLVSSYFLLILTQLIIAQDIHPDSSIQIQHKKSTDFFIHCFEKEKYDSLFIQASENLKSKLDTELIIETRKNLISWGGSLKSVEFIGTKRKGGYPIFSYFIYFEKTRFIADISIEDDSIAGFFIKPDASAQYHAPYYADPKKFYEVKVTIKGKEGDLPGLLTIPVDVTGKKVPLVILSWGSGPADLNEEVGACRPFQDLAWGLATKGIAVMRFPKRTFHDADYVQNHPKMTLENEYLNDMKAAIKVAKNRKEINHQYIFYVGHSLGAGILPWVMNEISTFHGGIAMAAPYRSIEEILPEQIDYLMPDSLYPNSPVKAAIREQIKNMKANLISDTLSPSMLPLNFPPAYWNHYKKHIKPETALRIKKPVLWLQGERDYQVKVNEIQQWKKLLNQQTNHEFVTYPALNHLMISGTQISTPIEYQTPGNIHPDVIDDIIYFIRKCQKGN